MLKILFSTILIFNFASLQSFASVCKTKCSFVKTAKLQEKVNDEHHENCHSTKKTADQKDSDENCGRVCQADDLIKSDSESVIDFKVIVQKAITFPIRVENYFLDNKRFFSIKTHDPPGYGFLQGLPIFIQKSSFLI